MNNNDEYRHWRLTEAGDDILRLTIDKAGAGTNVLSADVFDELDAILTRLEHSHVRGLIIASAKPDGFFAGADVREFTRIETAREALKVVQRGQAVFARIESLRFPTVVQIHGYCLGGGYELALACRYRVALDAPATCIGLPEVKLGIHPGYGGTVRLVRLLGAPAAMKLLLAGTTVDAHRAARLGMVDRAVPQRHYDAAALELIHNQPAARTPPQWTTPLNHSLLRPLVARYLKRQVARKVSSRHYPAPFAIIDLWRRHGDEPSRMLDEEAASCARLAVTPSARNLVRVFFLRERIKSLARRGDAGCRHVHVIGAGAMGGDIAAWCALQGLNVTLQDREPRFIAPALKRAAALFATRVSDPRRRGRIMDRLTPDHRGEGVADADVVLEAIVENADTKRALYESVEPRMKADALLATNTSSIPLDQLAQTLARPERLVGIHFFNPVRLMHLVEVISGPSTSAPFRKRALGFARAIDRLPLPVRSSPGFLVNRVLAPYLIEAVHLLSEGFAPEVVDAAAEAFGMHMGPVELADAIGLDICLAVGENLATRFEISIPELLRGKVAERALGHKTGRGFYQYRKGRPVRQAVKTDSIALNGVGDRMVYRMLNEAAACLREGIAADADLIDAGLIFGGGFAPFHGGPLHYAGCLGVDTVCRRLDELTTRHGPRFRPDPGWEMLQERDTVAAG